MTDKKWNQPKGKPKKKVTYHQSEVDRLLKNEPRDIYQMKIQGEKEETNWFTVPKSELKKIRNILKSD